MIWKGDEIMKVFIGTGGSGGHIFPALQVAETLRKQGHEVVFVGAFHQCQDLIKRNNFSVVDLPAKAWGVKSLKQALVSIECMLKSIWIVLDVIKKDRPQAIIGFGGYGSFPVVLAGYLKGVWCGIHEQNVVPGQANKLLGKFVQKVFVSFPESVRYFSSKKTVVSGYPLRSFDEDIAREECFQEFELSPDIFTILVCGGSQGSRALNQAVVKAVEKLKSQQNFQMIHISGKDDKEIVEMGYQKLGIKYKVFSFLHEMGKAYRIADMSVSRAGAGAIHELIKFNISSIIVPYPFAGGHQRQNALAYIKKGFGIMLEEKYLTADRLCTEILNFIQGRDLTNNVSAGELFAEKDAAKIIIEHLCEKTSCE